MTKRKSAIAAAVKAAAGGNSVFVLASRKDDLPADEKQLNDVLASAKISEFACTACGTSMHALSNTAPFCVTCGAGEEHVHVQKADAKTTVTSNSDLVSLHCTTCDHATTIEASVSKAIVSSGKTPTPIHCSCCGSEMYVKAEAEDGAGFTQNELVVPDVAKDPSDEFDDPALVAAKKLKAGTAVSAEAEDDEDVSLDDLEELDKVESNADNFGGKQAPPFKSKSEVDMEASAEDDDDEDLELEAFTVEEDGSEEPMLNSADEMVEDVVESDMDSGFPEPEGDPLVDALEMDDTDLALAFVRANGRVIAMKGHVSIASFSKASAGENYRLINSEALPVAAKAAVSAEGLRKGLESIGFALVKVPASNNAVVARKVQEIKASVATAKVEEKKQFASIFALAAAGLNRGSWKGYENPLRASVEAELSRLGVQAPKRVVAAIFEKSGIEYAKNLLEVSDRLSKMSASARRELAEMLDMTNLTASKADPEDEEEDSDEESVVASATLETRFAKPALLRPKITSSVQSYSGAGDVLSGKAPLAFTSV